MLKTPSFCFYHTSGCHLCDDAEAIIKPIVAELQSDIVKVDIANDDSLVELYGIRIPVLKNCQTQEELGWPFDYQLALDFMKGS